MIRIAVLRALEDKRGGLGTESPAATNAWYFGGFAGQRSVGNFEAPHVRPRDVIARTSRRGKAGRGGCSGEAMSYDLYIEARTCGHAT